jgi:hypothetical protein
MNGTKRLLELTVGAVRFSVREFFRPLVAVLSFVTGGFVRGRLVTAATAPIDPWRAENGGHCDNQGQREDQRAKTE